MLDAKCSRAGRSCIVTRPFVLYHFANSSASGPTCSDQGKLDGDFGEEPGR